MFDRRSGAAAAALRGQIYVCGGSDGLRRLRSVERYDPRTATWHAVPAPRPLEAFLEPIQALEPWAMGV